MFMLRFGSQETPSARMATQMNGVEMPTTRSTPLETSIKLEPSLIDCHIPSQPHNKRRYMESFDKENNHVFFKARKNLGSGLANTSMSDALASSSTIGNSVAVKLENVMDGSSSLSPMAVAALSSPLTNGTHLGPPPPIVPGDLMHATFSNSRGIDSLLPPLDVKVLGSPSKSSPPPSDTKPPPASATDSVNTAATFLTQLHGNQKPSNMAKYKVKPSELTPKTKQSCHQCKLSKPSVELVKCKNIVRFSSHGNKEAIWCKKKYCWKCLRKNYVGIQQDLEKWVCPACCNVCRCARCGRDREKAAREAVEAVEINDEHSNQKPHDEREGESPSKKRKLDKPLNAILIGPVPALEPLFLPKGQKKLRATVLPPPAGGSMTSTSGSNSYELSESLVSKIKPPTDKVNLGKTSDEEADNLFARKFRPLPDRLNTNNFIKTDNTNPPGRINLRPRHKRNHYSSRRNHVTDAVVSPKLDMQISKTECCMTCLKNLPDVVFIPCGHHLVCNSCLETREKFMKCCNECGADIKQSVKYPQRLRREDPVCYMENCGKNVTPSIFFPCKHVCDLYCKDCTEKPSHCPKCWGPVAERVTVISGGGQ